MLRPGIYEQVIDCCLAEELDHLPKNLRIIVTIGENHLDNVVSAALIDRRVGEADTERYGKHTLVSNSVHL